MLYIHGWEQHRRAGGFERDGRKIGWKIGLHLGFCQRMPTMRAEVIEPFSLTAARSAGPWPLDAGPSSGAKTTYAPRPVPRDRIYLAPAAENRHICRRSCQGRTGQGGLELDRSSYAQEMGALASWAPAHTNQARGGRQSYQGGAGLCTL